MKYRIFYRTDNLSVFYKLFIEGDEHPIPDDVYIRKFAHNAFELGTYDPDLVDVFDVETDADVDLLRAGQVLTIDDAQLNYTITKPQIMTDVEAEELEIKKVALYQELAVLNAAKSEMVTDSRDTTKVDALISDVEAKITNVYGA